MPYRFEPGRIYRMPTHFGPAPGPRQMPAEADADPTRSPHKTLISATFLTEGSALERHIPERFTLAGEPVVTIEFHYMTDIDWLAGRGYTMIHVWWPVTFNGARDRIVGRFLAVMWENLADPIITGRGEIGQPKLFADIPEPRLIDGAYHCEASWMGFKFLEVRVAESAQPDQAPLPQLQGTLMLKYVPRTGVWGEADICQVSFTPAATPNLTIESHKAANGSVKFHRATWRDLPTMYHVINALADLPVLSARAGSIATTRGGKSCTCPLSRAKRTCRFASQMSAFDPKRTSSLVLATSAILYAGRAATTAQGQHPDMAVPLFWGYSGQPLTQHFFESETVTSLQRVRS